MKKASELKNKFKKHAEEEVMVAAASSVAAFRSKVAKLKRALRNAKFSSKYFIEKAAAALKEVEVEEKYNNSHRGFKHKGTCEEERRYSFALCYGRAKFDASVKYKKSEKKQKAKIASLTAKLAKATKGKTSTKDASLAQESAGMDKISKTCSVAMNIAYGKCTPKFDAAYTQCAMLYKNV